MGGSVQDFLCIVFLTQRLTPTGFFECGVFLQIKSEYLFEYFFNGFNTLHLIFYPLVFV